MSKKEIAIICDGKNISFGINLFHIMRYRDNDLSFNCESLDDYDVEMYTPAVFKRSNISKKAITIFVGETSGDSHIVFQKYGIIISKEETTIKLSVDPNQLNRNEYSEFLTFANKQSGIYLTREANFYDRVKDINPEWIAFEFEPIKTKGLFSLKNEAKEKTQQCYNCAAYIVFTCITANTEENKNGKQ